MRKECANQNCSNNIEPERAKWADYCLTCASPAASKRRYRQKERDEDPLYTDYEPVKGKLYRETFHERDPAGRTYNQRVADWRKDNRERTKDHNRNHTKRHRTRRQLKLDDKIASWIKTAKPALTDEEVAKVGRICRRCSIEELPRLAELLEHWNTITNNAPRTATELFTRVKASIGGGEQSNEEITVSNRLEM